jgi:hypothetical protein
MMDTKVGQQRRNDPAEVARIGFEAMMQAGDVVSGWRTSSKTTLATVMPSGMLAEQHRGMAEPGSGK